MGHDGGLAASPWSGRILVMAGGVRRLAAAFRYRDLIASTTAATVDASAVRAPSTITGSSVSGGSKLAACSASTASVTSGRAGSVRFARTRRRCSSGAIRTQTRANGAPAAAAVARQASRTNRGEPVSSTITSRPDASDSPARSCAMAFVVAHSSGGDALAAVEAALLVDPVEAQQNSVQRVGQPDRQRALARERETAHQHQRHAWTLPSPGGALHLTARSQSPTHGGAQRPGRLRPCR